MSRVKAIKDHYIIEVKNRYAKHIERLDNYCRVLKETKDDNTILKSKADLEYIEIELKNTEMLLKMLGALIHYDFDKMSVDQVYRQRLGINSDRMKSLLMNGTRLCETEKEKINLFLEDLICH